MPGVDRSSTSIQPCLENSSRGAGRPPWGRPSTTTSTPRSTRVPTRDHANVILRREEAAATRSLAQTAKVLQENPLLIRLEELEACKEIAAKVGTVNVVLGVDAMTKLELKT